MPFCCLGMPIDLSGTDQSAKGGMGGNIPLNLALEHFNRVLKQLIKNMGPNASNEKTVNHFAKAMGVTKQLMDNFDLDCEVLKRAGHHVAKAATCDLKPDCKV